MESLTRIKTKIEHIHNNKAANAIAIIRDAVQESSLPIRLDIKRVPVSGDLSFCHIVINGDCFNIGGRKIVNDAIKAAKGA